MKAADGNDIRFTGDQLRFEEALDSVITGGSDRGIGTLGEKTLHAVLKAFYEPDRGCHEVRAGDYVADIARDGMIIEIQTRAFERLRDKLGYYLAEGYVVKVVYPVAAVRRLSWMDPRTGEIVEKRKSPRRGTVYDVAPELYKIKNRLKDPNLDVEVVLMEVTDIRVLDGKGKNAKIRATKFERIPNAFLGRVCLSARSGYAELLPDGLPEEFTSGDFAGAARIRRELAGVTLNVLLGAGAVERTGKKGRSYTYRRTSAG